jgi:O-acetyl-ADP-ribose deacetylase (regulator of RNase III)
MAGTPHDYVVRDYLSEDYKKVFDEFEVLIKKDGYVEEFFSQKYTYYRIGNYKYWVVENVLNRVTAKVKTELIAVKQDITKLEVDAIVNAANSTLLSGGGVDGAIHRSAGAELLAKCRGLGGCKTGEAKITKGYNLPAKFVIHTVGPIYGHENGQEAPLLRSCYWNSLELAQKQGLTSIAFPTISTGAFGYPKDKASQIAVETVREFVENNPDTFKKIYFVSFDDVSDGFYKRLLV